MPTRPTEPAPGAAAARAPRAPPPPRPPPARVHLRLEAAQVRRRREADGEAVRRVVGSYSRVSASSLTIRKRNSGAPRPRPRPTPRPIGAVGLRHVGIAHVHLDVAVVRVLEGVNNLVAEEAGDPSKLALAAPDVQVPRRHLQQQALAVEPALEGLLHVGDDRVRARRAGGELLGEGWPAGGQAAARRWNHRAHFSRRQWLWRRWHRTRRCGGVRAADGVALRCRRRRCSWQHWR